MLICLIYNLRDEESDSGQGNAEFNITFLTHVNCILDKLPSNICYINKIIKNININVNWIGLEQKNVCCM